MLPKHTTGRIFTAKPQRKSTPIITVSEDVLKTYEGIYVYDNSWATVAKKDNEYYFHTNNMDVKMHFTTPTHFFNTEFSSVKEFIKDTKGNNMGYTRTVDGKEYPKVIKVTNLDTLKLESNVFGDIGWYLFESKKYKEAISYFKRGLQLYPKDYTMLMNMAHVYLFNKDYKNAIAIYKAHLKDTVSPGNSWENQMQNDLIYFKEHHFDTQPFDKVFAELKIKKPMGY